MKPSAEAVERAYTAMARLAAPLHPTLVRELAAAALEAAMEPDDCCPCAEGSMDGKAHRQFGLVRLEE
jgi:hypothetical protein